MTVSGWADKLSLPNLGSFFETMMLRPRISAFIHSDRRMPKIKRVDGDYKYFEDSVRSAFRPKLTNHVYAAEAQKEL